MTAVFPAGGQRGTKVAVTCSGTFEWPVQVWTPGVETTLAADSGKLEISVPPDLPADRAWIRLYNAEGASAAVPFLIDSLEELTEQEPNNALEQAQPLPSPQAIVNGVLTPSGDVDGFAVSLEAGQTLVAALAANSRLGSPMDAILQVATPEGFVVAENHDAVGLDPRLAFTAPRTGTYIARVFAFPSDPNQTIAFAGAETYIYRLTLTTGPYITSTAPLAVSDQDPGAVGALGWNLPENTQLPVHVYGGAALAAQPEYEPFGRRVPPDSRLGLIFDPGYAGSGRVRLVPYPVPRTVASGDPDSSQVFTPPTSLTGVLRQSGETDVYDFALTQGQPLVIAAATDSIDSPAVPVMRLFKPDGSLAAETGDPGTNKETELTFVAAEDGVHRLQLHDRYRHGSDWHVYRLSVFVEQPDFDLSVTSDTVTVSPDKPAEIEVSVERRAPAGMALGPISLSVADLPDGITSAPVVSEPEGDSAKKVKLSITSTGSGFSGPIRIVGEAHEPRELQRTARTPPRFGSSLDRIWLTAVAAP
ncbi:MAG: PPC domain-containing protein [Planctomycetaceae bacterium]